MPLDYDLKIIVLGHPPGYDIHYFAVTELNFLVIIGMRTETKFPDH